jgi:hypothetical protein
MSNIIGSLGGALLVISYECGKAISVQVRDPFNLSGQVQVQVVSKLKAVDLLAESVR